MSIAKQPAATAEPTARWNSGKWSVALLIIGLVAFALRWYYVSHAVVYQPVRGDAVQYHAYAENLVRHGVFSMSSPNAATVAPDSFRDPGYPVFLAGWMSITSDFGGWYAAVLMSQAFLGALTAMLLMSAARPWISDGWLVGAGVLMALWPHSVTITSFLLTETLVGFFTALAFWLWIRGVHQRNWRWVLAAGGTFGLAGLTNAVMLPFAPLLAAVLMLTRRISWRLGLALLAGALVLPTAWGIRNLQLHAGASSNGRALINLVQGSWPEYHSGYLLSVMGNPEGTRIMQKIQAEQDLILADKAAGLREMAARMSEAPLRYFGWYLSKPGLLWDWSIRMGQGDVYVYPTLHSPFSENAALRVLISICRAVNPLLMVLAFAGLLLAVRDRANDAAALSAALLVAFVTVVYSVLQSEPRYSIPFRGFEMLLVARALYGLKAIVLRNSAPSSAKPLCEADHKTDATGKAD